MISGRLFSSVGSIGIDLGASGIKMLQLREKSGTLRPVGAATIALEDGVDTEPEQITDRLRATLGRVRFHGRRCVVSLPRTDVRLQSIRLPKMPSSELRQAATWEASQRFGLEREAMEADYVRTGAMLQSSESREEILLIAVAHETVEARLAAILETGLRPIAIDTSFAALSRTFGWRARRAMDRDQVRVVVEVGASGTSVMILRGDQIALCKPIGISGVQFNEAVAEHLQLSLGEAAKLRADRIMRDIRGGSADPTDPSTDRAVYEAVRPLMGELVREVLLCHRYYGVTFRGHPPQHIVLTGGDGMEPRLDDMLSEACKVPVVYDHEESTLHGLLGRVTTQSRTALPPASWAVAAGLSLRTVAGAAARRPVTQIGEAA